MVKWLANFIVSAIVLMATLYFVVSLCIGFFKLNGMLTEGQPMYIDLNAPTWGKLIIFQAVCVSIIGCGFYLRRKLRRK